MANRYWVGGAGTWDATTTTNWSATSGGGGGASAPTSVDNVIFDTLSNATAYAVTVGTNANAADITIAGPAAGNVTITWSATSVINCYGSWTNAATGVVLSTSSGCNTNFLATTTGKTFTTNSVTFGTGSNINFNGVGGGWTLGSALTTLGAINVNAGTFNTGSYSITASFINSSNTAVRSINLGSSTITLSSVSPWVFTITTNLTFNANTSTIVCSSGATITFAGSGLTYYNVSFTSAAGSATIITGTNTFNNLNQTSPTSSRRVLSLGANQIISGTLTLGAANAYNARIFVQSDTAGTSRTLTVATIATLADVDFRDVTAAGASAPWSGTRLGNGLGNTSITFVAGKTVYWNLVAGGNWSANAWATSSGGAVATANFPLAQDTVIIDNTGLTAGNTITMDSPWFMGTLNVTRTNAWTLALSTGPVIYGDFTIPSVTTVTGASAITFQGQGLTQTLTTNGVSLSTPITVTSVGGTVLLNGAVTCAATATVTLTAGTLDLNDYTLSTGLFSSNNTNARTIAFGTGNIILTGNNTTIWNTGVNTNLTYTTIPTVNATYSGAVGTRVFATAGLADRFNLNITAGTDIIAPSATFTVNNYNFTGFSGTLTNVSTQIYGSLTLSTGMTVPAGASTFLFTGTGSRTITSAGQTMDFPITFNGVGGTWQLQDALTSGGSRTCTLTAGTLDLHGYTLTTGLFSSNNTNARTIAFGSGDITITGVSGTVFSGPTSTNTGLTITGTAQVNVTGNGTTTRTVNPGNSLATSAPISFTISNGSDTINSSVGMTFNNLTFTSSFTGIFGNVTRSIFGNLTLDASITSFSSGASTLTFTGTGSQTITTAGETIDCPITFDGVGGTWQLQDALTSGATRTCTLTAGTLDLNDNSLTTGIFSSSNSNARTLAFFNTGAIFCTSASTTADVTVFNTSTSTNFTVTGTSKQVIISGAPTSFVRSVLTGLVSSGGTEANAVNVYVYNGSDTINLGTSDSVFLELALGFGGFTGNLAANVAPIIYAGFSFFGGGTIPGGANAWTFKSTTSGNFVSSTAVINNPVTFDGVGGEWDINSSPIVNGAVTLTNGTLKIATAFPFTVGSFVTSGTNQKFLKSQVPGTQATISAASGTNSVSYLTIQDSNATGGATFYAIDPTNVNAGNNTGWIFRNPTGGSGGGTRFGFGFRI